MKVEASESLVRVNDHNGYFFPKFGPDFVADSLCDLLWVLDG
jgi:hypothetical protein